MGFLDDDDEVPEEADGKSRARIEAGGIPLSAERRLRHADVDGRGFTSSLSVSEFALLQELRPVPVAQVLGASVYHVGWQYLPQDAQWGGVVCCELDQVSHAWDQARRRAFDRLTREAMLVGADAVVGVRLKRGEHDWARNTVDYLVSGTAIRYRREDRSGRPLLSDLSVQEYWQLSRSGWGPAGLVAATAVFFVSQSMPAKWRRRVTVAKNQDLSEFSAGSSAARERAMRYLRSQADAADADGIVGVRLEHRVSTDRIRVAIPTVQPTGLSPSTIALGGGHYQRPTGKEKRDGMIIIVHVAGTAIRCRSPGPTSPPRTMLSLQS